jgi:hypothetical protein
MLFLSPDKPEDIPRFPDANTEITREPGEVLDIAARLNIPDKAITVLRVKTGHFTLNVSINTLRRADRLVVTFTGARGGGQDAATSKRPMFARRHWDVLYGAPILAISDPQAEVDWESNVPRAGFYMGTFEHDLVPEILALIDKVCEEIGVNRNRVVLAGAAAGGTAAILVGSRRREGTGVIAACPLLRPDKYREQVIATWARAAGGDLALWERTSEDQPWRNNPLTALRDGLASGNDVRVVVAQNVRDRMTINRHFAGLWRRFDIDPEGGIAPNGRVLAALYDWAGAGHGHGQEPPEFSRPLIELAYGFFDSPVETTPRKARKKPAPQRDSGQDAAAA